MGSMIFLALPFGRCLQPDSARVEQAAHERLGRVAQAVCGGDGRTVEQAERGRVVTTSMPRITALELRSLLFALCVELPQPLPYGREGRADRVVMVLERGDEPRVDAARGHARRRSRPTLSCRYRMRAKRRDEETSLQRWP